MRAGAGGRPSRRLGRTALAAVVLFGLVVASPPPGASAQGATLSGSRVYSFGSTVASDLSNYTVYYTMPQVIQAGVETNMSFFVYVTVLSGWKIQSQTQILTIIINTPTTQVVTEKAQNNVTLYQGGRWGPFNMAFDINASQAGLAPGQATNATVFGNLVVYEALDDPVSPFVHDSGATFKLADVQIAAGGRTAPSANRLLTSVFLGGAVVTALTGFTLATRKKHGSEMPRAAAGPARP
ncbi:MAG: hypothetical protein JRN58_08815 [Nitrososphaerota archaeon]|nr:hypothetical protein [Nitrososphaerota archaeon]